MMLYLDSMRTTFTIAFFASYCRDNYKKWVEFTLLGVAESQMRNVLLYRLRVLNNQALSMLYA